MEKRTDGERARDREMLTQIILWLMLMKGSGCWKHDAGSSCGEYNGGAIDADHQDQRESLLVLKQSLQDEAGHLDDWGRSSRSHCSWRGVTCGTASGQVTALRLDSMGLQGILPSGPFASLGSLRHVSMAANRLAGPLPETLVTCLPRLRFLNVSRNALDGPFPARSLSLLASSLEVLDVFDNNFSGPLPPEIAHLRRLRHLHLGGNALLSGPIPPQYGSLPRLAYLALNGNSLSGRIPPQLGNLASLQYLFLGYDNQFDGGLPPALGSLINLILLDASRCGLSGTIPPQLGSLAKLQTLFLHTNSLHGSIPRELGNLTRLESLDLSENSLTGTIPPELGLLHQLELLHLFHNFLHGPIPPSIALHLPNLQTLKLFNNNLTGQVPQQLGLVARNLMDLDLSYNLFTGNIPPYLCSGGNLGRFVLMYNRFSGPIPSALTQHCPKLYRIRLGNNNLTGPLPPGILALPSLNFLELPSNRIEGTIPHPIASDSKLELIDISNNLLTGILPSSIANLAQLVDLNLQGNMLSGSIPDEIGHLTNLSTINLSNNLLSGKIPAALGSCKRLTLLDVSCNHLEGNIFPQVSDLAILDVLNVSRNHLGGSIPTSMQRMEALTVMDFSYNNLSGAIPDKGPFVSSNASSFYGNPGLCGELIWHSCTPDSSNRETDSQNFFRTTFGHSFITVLFVVLLVVLLVVLCKVLWRSKVARAWKLIAFETLEFTALDVVNCIKHENIISKGGTATVYKGCLPNGQTVAIKRLKLTRKYIPQHTDQAGLYSDDSTTALQHVVFETEIETLGQIRHRNIVRLLGYCSNKDTNLLLLEYMPNGSLGELLHGVSGGSLSWGRRYKIAIGAAKGLTYLHHEHAHVIIHRDVKSNNILLDECYEAHVADFGLAKALRGQSHEQLVSRVAGSSGYIAPEYAHTLKVSEKSDVYSFGVILLELITGRTPIIDEPEYGSMDLPQWVHWKWSHSQEEGIFLGNIVDARLLGADMNTIMPNRSTVLQEIRLVLHLALLCVCHEPDERPSSRHIVQVLTDGSKSWRERTTKPFPGESPTRILARENNQAISEESPTRTQ